MHLEKHNFNRKVALYNPLLTLDFKGPEKTNNKSYMILLTPFPTKVLVHFANLLIT